MGKRPNSTFCIFWSFTHVMEYCFALVYNYLHLAYRYFRSKFIPTDQQSHPPPSPALPSPPTPFYFLVLFRFQIPYDGYYTIKHMLRRDPAGWRPWCVPGMCSATSISRCCFFLPGKNLIYILSIWATVL